MTMKTHRTKSAYKIGLVKSRPVDYAVRAHRRALPSAFPEGFYKTSNNVVHLVRDVRFDRIVLCYPGAGLSGLSKNGCQGRPDTSRDGMPERSAYAGEVAGLAQLKTDKGVSCE